MSIAEFSAVLQDAAYKSWFPKSGKSILIHNSKELRKTEETANRTNFFISLDSISEIGQRLVGRDLTSEEVNTIFADLKTASKPGKTELIAETLGSGKEVTGVYYRKVAFDGDSATSIPGILARGFKSLDDKLTTIVDNKGKERAARISDFYQKGHVLGIATNVTEQTERNIEKSRTIPGVVKNRLLEILRATRDQLTQDDLASSNVKDPTFSLYAQYSKNPYSYLVEMQLAQVNAASGTRSALFTNALSRYLAPNNSTAISRFFREKSSDGDKLIQKLISTKGSPSYLDLVGIEMGDILSGKRSQKQFSSAKVKVADVTQKFDFSEVNKAIKEQLRIVNDEIRAVENTPVQKSAAEEPQLPLASLQLLLQQSIADKIKENMGDGTRKDILNLRSGRLAESVTIERLTQSRTGAISVFYNYMKYPYATFSAGGKQQSPRTRDPKTLISTSIRELGAKIVTNKMRAVLV